ncbi:carbohydrate kinase family protein [Mycoplasmatota bacterium]|nr:carbohydrate kinase family protein [Mycoplasmatota bacterium]
MKKITILGIACVDIIVSGSYNIPKAGQLEFVDGMNLYTGGCAMNCSIDLSIMKIPHQLIIPIGDDFYGDFIVEKLKNHQIHTDHLIRFKDTSTSSSVVLLNPQGERSFLHHPGANGVLQIEDIDLSILDQTDILFIGGALLMPRFDGQQMKDLLKYAKDKGVYTVLDIGWDPLNQWMDTLVGVLAYVDLFVPSIDEAKMLSKLDDVKEMNDYFKNKGVKELIIKLGDQGAAYFDKEKTKILPSIKTGKIIDTTGAGDSFMAGILTGLYHDWPKEKTIQFANTLGSLCIQDYGASGLIRDFKQMIKIQEEYYKK